ncbi:MAG: hypothetical protein FGM14_14425 [Flavobacteriales bacterium]|nr:hypothetical protein [Flavobacteriales bacterium]
MNSMNQLHQHIKNGQVYRRSDLEYYSNSIDRHLAELTSEGLLIKVSQGLYYAPRKSKFGIVPPDDNSLIERFLKDDDFLLVSPNSYNGLGFGLTQLYNITWVYNHKRKGKFELNGKLFEFTLKTSFPKTVTKEFLLVDLLNHKEYLAEDQAAIINKLPSKLEDFDLNELMKITQQYGSGKTKRILKSHIRKKISND